MHLRNLTQHERLSLILGRLNFINTEYCTMGGSISHSEQIDKNLFKKMRDALNHLIDLIEESERPA